MIKIKSIKINNFKFFDKQSPIEIGGKNLLLYGENGSGKSTIYWALYTLLESSGKRTGETDCYFEPLSTSKDSLVNINAPEMSCVRTQKKHCDSYIEIESNEIPPKKYHISLLDTAINQDVTAKESMKASDFINYQSLFKFQDFKHREDNNLYEIFNNAVLPYVLFPSYKIHGQIVSNGSDMWAAFQQGSGKTKNYKGDTIQVYKNSADNINYNNFAKHFIREFHDLIDFINIEAPEILKKLGYDIDFELNLIDPTHKKKDKSFNYIPFKVSLSITKYHGQNITIKKAHSFLNEAKITALAIAIRIAILTKRSGSETTGLKLIVFDDVMISLDMSNRDVLINYIFENLVNKFQIIILTHSKEFEQFIKHKLTQLKDNDKSNWICKEMYTSSNEQNHECPMIIDTDMSNLKKATRYYKLKDYETASLYVRKSLEEVICQRLPSEFLRNIDDKFISLTTRWNKFTTLYSNLGHPIDDDIDELFRDSKLLVLNPSAHYQRLSVPIYKKELERAFELIDKISQIAVMSKKLLIEKDKKIIFKHPNEKYLCDFKLKKDLIIEHGDTTILNIPKCYDVHFEYNNIPFYDFDTKKEDENHPLKSASPKLSNLINGMKNIPLGITTDIFVDNSSIEGISLKEYIGNVNLD